MSSRWVDGSIALRIAELRLRDFRNYAAEDATFGDGITVFAGPNAQGKSNLLESIYTVAVGRSPRATADVELVRFGQDRAYVRAVVEGGRASALEVAVDRVSGEKRIKVNGVVTQRGQLLGRLAVVLAGPLDDEMIRGGPGYRRRLMDAALSQMSPSYYFNLSRYLRVVRQRNRLLKAGSAAAALAPWDTQLVELGAGLVERRRQFVDGLAVRARARHARIAMGEEVLDITYSASGIAAGADPVVDARAQLARALADRRGEELRRGTTVVGPHRDDLGFTVNGVDLRVFGSRGQQHTAALSLRLGEVEFLRDELGEWPVVLLDDVLADLDPSRQAALLAEVIGPQVLMTHTRVPDAAGVSVRHVSVMAGKLVGGADVRA